MTYIAELKDAIRKRHGVESKHVESVPIEEEFQGKTVWEGVVEVFELIGHPKVSRLDAWSHDIAGQKTKHITVLHLPPVDSPRTAVRAAIVRESRLVKETE